MIKIQEHIDIPDADDFLDKLAIEHWNNLNPKRAKDNEYYVHSVINICKKWLEKTNTAEYITKYAGNNSIVANRHKAFLDYLAADSFSKLKQIIISRPNEFSMIKNEIFSILQSNDLLIYHKGRFIQTKFGALLSDKIFDYKKFRNSHFCKELLIKIGFKSATCPYCNNNKLDVIVLNKNSSKDEKLKAYLDIDHFYPKAQNPFFALSFFNLIPSCHKCNSGDKGDKEFSIETHIHPYQEAFDDYYRFNISLTALIGDPIEQIRIENNGLKPEDQTLSDLNLLERYNNNLASINKLIKYFANNKHLIGTENESSFVESFLMLAELPVLRKEILGTLQGKMIRDVVMQLDVKNVLQIR